MATPKWKSLADRLAGEIRSGTYAPGDPLPHIRALVEAGEGSKATVNRAYQELEAEGLVRSVRGRGTVVRDRRRIRVPLSRYGQVLEPGGNRGPWETATAAQGLDGAMVVSPPEILEASPEIAQSLGIEIGSPVLLRHRRATISGDVIQLQNAWYPLDIAQAAGIDKPGKVVGGVLGAMVGAGLLPTEADEHVTAWIPTDEEAAALTIGTRVPALLIERVTRDQSGRAVELVRITAAADRIELVYDNLPLNPKPKRMRSPAPKK